MITYTWQCELLKNRILPSPVVPNDTKVAAGRKVPWLDKVSVGDPENFIKSPYNKDFFLAHGSPTFSRQPLHYVPDRLLSLETTSEEKTGSISYAEPQP